MKTKHEPAEKPSAAPEKTEPKAVSAAAAASGGGVHLDGTGAPGGTPKREYPTLGYE